MRYCFDFYVRLTDLLEAKSGNLQWENLENLLLKQIANLLKKKITSVTLMYNLKNTFCTVIMFYLHHLWCVLKKNVCWKSRIPFRHPILPVSPLPYLSQFSIPPVPVLLVPLTRPGPPGPPVYPVPVEPPKMPIN